MEARQSRARTLRPDKVKVLVVAAVAAALVGAFVSAPAKSPPGGVELLPLESAKPPAEKSARVHIMNDGRIPLAFYLSTNNRNWKQFRLTAGKGRYYSSAVKDLKFLYIKVKTRKRGFVNYRLRTGGRFMIRWNKDKAVWDVMRIEYVKEEKPATTKPAS